MKEDDEGYPIVIAAHQDFSARYLLGTDILAGLKSSGAPLTLLTPGADDLEFLSTFDIKNSNIKVAQYEYQTLGKFRKSLVCRFFIAVRYLTLPEKCDIFTVLFHERLERLGIRKTGFLRNAFFKSVFLTASVLRKSSLLRTVFFRLETTLIKSVAHEKFFKDVKPSLLVLSDIGTTAMTGLLMGEARRHNVPIVSVVLSWDNLTSKGMTCIQPDYFIAWNENMADELVQYHGADRERIYVGGVAHFDRYFSKENVLNRNAFCDRFGLSPDRKFILFGSGTPSFFYHNMRVIRFLLQAMKDGVIKETCQLLVRLHPAYFTKTRHWDNTSNALDELDALAREFDGLLHVINPQTVNQSVGALLPIDDQDVLAAILKHSNVMVNVFSTLMLEACIFDLPVVNIAFYNYRDTDIQNSELKEFTHLKRIMDYQATREAYSEQQMLDLINFYLEDKSQDSESRQLVREQEAGPNKGRAGKAIAQRITALAGFEHKRRCC